jgi:SAM-dependent methyltransferase
MLISPTPESDAIVDEVRAYYAGAARAVMDPDAPPSAALESNKLPIVDAAGCCDPGCCADGSAGHDAYGSALYDAGDLADIPEAASLASLGCGNPTAVAELHAGETVLDLGSGGGIDVLLSARRVGPSGRAYGLDMTPEMLDLARRNAAEAGATNVEFLEGRMEAIPLPSSAVDVVISNCVVNLSVDKPAVFREIARVLRPGGRVGISDVVADDHLTLSERLERGSLAGCIAGALSFSECRAGLAAVGLTDIVIEPTHGVADGMYAATIRATKPA